MSYTRFGAIIVTSTVVMFGLMYLNTYALDHVWFSQTRTWMAFVLGAVMTIIMLGFMWAMYENKKANAAIIASSVVILQLSLVWPARRFHGLLRCLWRGRLPACPSAALDPSCLLVGGYCSMDLG
jgi:hypothetical protein